MPRRAHSRRENLLCAASELMAEVGYSAMSMRQLAAQVGVLPGSLYHHVASKQDLLLDVLLHILARRLDAWRYGGYPRNLQGYLCFMLKRQCSHPGEERLLRHESRHINVQQRSWLQAAQQRLREPLLQYLAGVHDAPGVSDALQALLDTADSLRHRDTPMDEAAIQAWVLRTSRLLITAPSPV